MLIPSLAHSRKNTPPDGRGLRLAILMAPLTGAAAMESGQAAPQVHRGSCDIPNPYVAPTNAPAMQPTNAVPQCDRRARRAQHPWQHAGWRECAVRGAAPCTRAKFRTLASQLRHPRAKASPHARPQPLRQSTTRLTIAPALQLLALRFRHALAPLRRGAVVHCYAHHVRQVVADPRFASVERYGRPAPRGSAGLPGLQCVSMRGPHRR